jgi:hypothetical protein
MLELVAQTEPEPFLERTIELGAYLGIRREGVLVAMAGERFRLDGWTEISAVCTKSDHRGQGLASQLMSALIVGIQRRSETPFLHVLRTNTAAIRLYEELGFAQLLVVLVPAVLLYVLALGAFEDTSDTPPEKAQPRPPTPIAGCSWRARCCSSSSR